VSEGSELYLHDYGLENLHLFLPSTYPRWSILFISPSLQIKEGFIEDLLRNLFDVLYQVNTLLSYLHTYLDTYILTYLFTYLVTYLLHGAVSSLRIYPVLS